MTDPFERPDPAAQRHSRAFAALNRLTDRHAGSMSRRQRHLHPHMPSPDELVKLTAGMAGGTVPAAPGEPEPDVADLMAALTLVPQARADLDNVELALLTACRGRGMTWQDIAFGLGLATAQAGKQRYDRLRSRTEGTV